METNKGMIVHDNAVDEPKLLARDLKILFLKKYKSPYPVTDIFLEFINSESRIRYSNLYMDIFFTILLKILPLYIFVVIGFIAGKYLDIDAKGIGKLIIYIIAPFVIFEAITHSNLSLTTFVLPMVAFIMCSFVAFHILFIRKNIFTLTLELMFWQLYLQKAILVILEFLLHFFFSSKVYLEYTY